MRYLNIRQLLSLLIGIGMILAVAYSSVGYYFLKQATEKAIEMESLNRAYAVTKQMGGLYDRIANEYEEREDENTNEEGVEHHLLDSKTSTLYFAILAIIQYLKT